MTIIPENRLFYLKKNNKYYEVNASHCSCYGLEGQWKPEETTFDVLLYRLKEGLLGKDYYGYDLFSKELIQYLKM